jgi:hypothetical protein
MANLHLGHFEAAWTGCVRGADCIGSVQGGEKQGEACRVDTRCGLRDHRLSPSASAPQLKLMVCSIGSTHQGYLIALSVLSLTFRPNVSPSLTFAFKLHLIGILLVVSPFFPPILS